MTGVHAEHAVIAYVHPGTVRAEFAQSLLAVAREGTTSVEAIVGLHSGPNISRARNAVTAMFMDDHSAEWLFMCDTDMWFAGDTVDRLIATADEYERPIVGALCFSTGENGASAQPTMYTATQACDGTPRFIPWRQWPEDECVRVDATGAACLLMHRSALRSVAESAADAAAPWFRETSIGGVLLGEDLTFCRRCADAGVPIHVHTGIRTGHMKTVMIADENRW